MATLAAEAGIGVLKAGAQVAGSSLKHLMDDSYRVMVGVDVENWTCYPLTDARVRIHGGRVCIPPLSILPNHHDVMVTRKRGYTATGSYGTISWFIEGLNRRVVVMWSAPFNFDFYNNMLAVGITTPGYVEHPEGRQLFNQMYDGYNSPNLRFQRRAYVDSLDPVTCRDDDIEVTGTMSTTHKAVVKIIVRPRNMERQNMAPPVRNLLQQQQQHHQQQEQHNNDGNCNLQ